MRIKWLDAAFSEAVVTRGIWRKESARVRLKGYRYDGPNDWTYVDTAIPCETSLERWLDGKKHAREAQRKVTECEQAWQPVNLPAARVVKP